MFSENIVKIMVSGVGSPFFAWLLKGKNSHAVVHSASISADTLPETQQFPDLLHPPGSWSANRAEESGEGGCSGILFM